MQAGSPPSGRRRRAAGAGSGLQRNTFEYPLLRVAVAAAVAFLFAFTSATASAADILAADKVTAPEALLPYLSWFADPQGEVSVRDLGAGTVQERFTPLYKGIPLKNKGPVWFRLLIVNSSQSGVGAVPAQGGARLSMNLGRLPPGGARLFYSESPGPVSAPGVWHSETVNSQEETLLPEAGLAPLAVYIRMEEMPSLWFSPVVGPQSAARAGLLPLDLLLPGLTAAAAVACLLRLAADRALWALWAALYLICVLGQTSLPLPSPDRGPAPENLPALLAPGLALMILPHVGRCMFRTDKASVLKDGSLYFCSLMGTVTAILPLVPGFSWLTRLFPLWPLLLLPALPFCLSSMAAKKPGALAFSGAVVMPVLGSLLCLAALKYTDLHPAAAQGGLWGLAVGGLGLALARTQRTSPGSGTGEENTESLVMPDTPGGLGAAFSVLSPQSQYEELPPMAITRIGGAGDAEPGEAPRTGNNPENGQQSGDAASGGKTGLLRATGAQPERAQDISFFLPSGEDRFYPDLPSEVMNILEGSVPTGNVQPGSYPFNLHTLVRQVHDIVSPLAESKGLIFSWYMSPSLPILLEGDSPRLRGALILLLQSAVQAADGGAVQLAVRRNPMSSFDGDLLFSISDNGSVQRTDAGFFLAWELASRNGGAFTVDYSASGGTRTAFTVRFKLLGDKTAVDLAASALPSHSEPESAPSPPRISGNRSLCILPAEMTGSARRHIARCLEGVSHTRVDAFDEEQLLRLAGEHEPDLVIFDADMPENVIARCIADLRVEEGAKGRKHAAVLVLTGHDMQAARLMEAGAGYVLGKPFTRETFLDALAAAVPTAASQIRSLSAAVADRSGMFTKLEPTPAVFAQYGDAGRDTPSGAVVAEPAAAYASGGSQSLPTAPDRFGQSPGEAFADDFHAAKLPRPSRLIPRGMTPDASPSGESLTEAAPAALFTAGGAPASAAAPVPAGASEPAPGTGGASGSVSDEAEESDAAKLPRPARLIPRGMAAERPEDGSSREAADPAGPPAPDDLDDPDSALMPGQRLTRDPFLDPSVAFLRPTFTPPGRPPLREAVKLAMTAGQEASSAVSDAPETQPDSAGHEVRIPRTSVDAPASPTNPTENGRRVSPTAPAARKTPENPSGGRRRPLTLQDRSGQSPDAPLLSREQRSGTVDAQAVQQPQASPKTGVRLQVQSQPAVAKRLSFSAGKGDDGSGPARQAPGIAGADRGRAGGAAHPAAERPGAVQVQLPPRHGIQPKGETGVGPAGNEAGKPQQQAGTPHGMQVSVLPAESRAGAPPSPQVSQAPRSTQGRSGQRGDASSAQTGRAQTVQIKSSKARAGRTGAGQAPVVHAGAGQTGAGQAATGQAATGQAGAEQTATGQAATGQAGAGQAGAGQAGAKQAGAEQAATEQAAAPRGETQTPFENALSGMGGEVVPATIGRAASDAAPIVMGLSPDDVVAPATAPAATPDKRAEAGKPGLPEEEYLLDLDAIRAPGPDEDGKQAGAARGQEKEKRDSSGYLIDFMVLDAEQDNAGDGVANETGKTDAPRAAAGAGPGNPGPAAPQSSAGNPAAAKPDAKAPITSPPASPPVPLPGLDGEFLDSDALPFLPGLTDALAGALRDAAKGMDEMRMPLVQEASARMASRAEHFGLSRLGRLARCLERAAEAQDEEASRAILEDLQRAAQQYEKALKECFHSFAGVGG